MNEQLAIQIAVGLIGPQETFSPTAYWDVNGYAIGYGFHYYQDGSSVQQGDTMTKSDADAYLTVVAAGKWQAIKPCITVPINENQAAALIDLAYNCGEGTECKSDLLKLINSGAPADQVAAQFEQTCVTAGGQYLSVLYKRRVDDVQLFFANAKQYVQNNPVQVLIGGLAVAGLFGFLLYRTYIKKK